MRFYERERERDRHNIWMGKYRSAHDIRSIAVHVSLTHFE